LFYFPGPTVLSYWKNDLKILINHISVEIGSFVLNVLKPQKNHFKMCLRDILRNSRNKVQPSIFNSIFLYLYYIA